jgi:hypothetical protein
MRYRNPYVKRFCKYLNIRVRNKYEILEAMEWFIVLMCFALLNFMILIEIRTLFRVTYTLGNYNFSLVPVEIGLNLMELGLILLSSCAFGHLVDGIIKSNDAEL